MQNEIRYLDCLILKLTSFFINTFHWTVILQQRDHNLKHNFVETQRKFIIAKISIRKLGSSSALSIYQYCTDEDPRLRIESFAVVNLRGVSTKLYFNLIFTMHTYKEFVFIS